MTAAFLSAQLEQARSITLERIGIWNKYHRLFEDLEKTGKICRPSVPEACKHNGHIYYLILDKKYDRDIFISKLDDFGIKAVFHYQPLHSSPAGIKYGQCSGVLKNTESVSERIVRLPIWLGFNEQEKILESINKILKHNIIIVTKRIVENYFVVTCLIIIVLELYFSNKGFDLTDEAFNLLRFEKPNIQIYSLLGEYMLIGFIFDLLDFNLTYLRILNLIFSILISLFTCLIFNRLKLTKEINSKVIFSFVFILQTPSFWMERIIAYNSISMIGIIIIATVLLYIHHREKTKIKNYLLIFCASLSVYLSYVRPPSLISISVIFIIYFILNYKNLKRDIVWVLLGFIIPFAILIPTENGIYGHFEKIRSAFQMSQLLSSESIPNMFSRNLSEIFQIFKLSLGKFKFEYLCLLVLPITKKYKHILLVPIVFSIILKSYFFGSLDGGFSFYWKFLFLFLQLQQLYFCTFY